MRTQLSPTRIAVTALCAALTMTAAAPVRAETITREVSTQGLDLRVPADQARLKHRIAVAARQVCTQGDEGDFDSAGMHDCQRDAFQAAWQQAEVKIAAARTGAMVASK